ncbi:MAG: ARMT1-like domain-containing protein [Desulfobacteraceae bacterium]
MNAAPDPLYEAVKLAIIGNSVDFMMSDKSVDTLEMIKKRMEYALPEETFKEFVGKLNSTRRLLYIGDNAGEIVFDKLLIETIREGQDVEIFFVVRSVPILNDVTLREAQFVGMDRVATVIENGIDSPLPGTILKRCSRELRELVERADLIISKGGGNFDTLDEERKRLDMNITFMFLSKCYPYKRHFGVELSNPIMANFFERNGTGSGLHS